jgi:hypothetical protein
VYLLLRASLRSKVCARHARRRIGIPLLLRVPACRLRAFLARCALAGTIVRLWTCPPACKEILRGRVPPCLHQEALGVRVGHLIPGDKCRSTRVVCSRRHLLYSLSFPPAKVCAFLQPHLSRLYPTVLSDLRASFFSRVADHACPALMLPLPCCRTRPVVDVSCFLPHT